MDVGLGLAIAHHKRRFSGRPKSAAIQGSPMVSSPELILPTNVMPVKVVIRMTARVRDKFARWSSLIFSEDPYSPDSKLGDRDSRR